MKNLTTKSDMTVRQALLLNAIFSGISGLIFSIFSSQISTLMGLSPSWVLMAVGIGLLGFSASLVWLAKKSNLAQNEVFLVVGSDAMWIVGTIILLVGFPNFLSTTGNWISAIAAIVVGGMAGLQFYGAKKMM